MAIIYSYPQIEEVSGSDLLLICDNSKANRTYSASVTQLSDYVIDQIGFNGVGFDVADTYIPVFDSAANSLISSVISQYPNGNIGIGIDPQFNRKLDVDGNAQVRKSLYVGAADTNLNAFTVEVGQGRSGNGYAFLDLVGDTTHQDYGLRVIRGNSGQDAVSQIKHRGNGLFSIIAEDNANIALIGGGVGIGATFIGPGQKLKVQGTSRNVIVSSGGNLGIGVDIPAAPLHCEGTIKSNGRIVADKFFVDGLNPAPNTPTSPGQTGEIRFTADYIYVCVADNTWKRVAINSWT